MVEVENARYPGLRKEQAQAAEQAAFEAREAASAREVAARAASTVLFTTAAPHFVPYVPLAPDAQMKKNSPDPQTPPAHASSAPDSVPVENATAPPAPAPPTEHRRRFYGVVYNAATLKPVAGAKLIFRVNTSQNGWPATTNELGHYQLDLVKATIETSMVVEISTLAGYRQGQLEDTDPPLRAKPRSVRRRIVEETSDSDLDPVPLRYQLDADIVPLDLVLIPQHGKVTQ